jgi:hypothetical protein
MVATPFLPERPSQVPGRRQRFIAGMDERRLVIPGLAVAARRHNDLRPPRVRRPIDAPRIVSAVTTETSQRLVRAELSEQSFGLDGVTLTVVGHFHRPHIQGLGIDGQMDLAPGTTVLGTLFFDFPLALAADFDARAVDQQVRRTCLATNGNLPESVTRTAKTLAWHEFPAFFCSPGG